MRALSRSRVSGAAGYFDYFGAKAGEPDKGYYSYDLGMRVVDSGGGSCH